MIANSSPDTTRVRWVANFSHTWSSVMVSFMKIRSSSMAEMATMEPISFIFSSEKPTCPIHEGRSSCSPICMRETKFS